MSDDTKSDDNTVSEWVMPEPVFRSTPGRTPQSTYQTESADDITTQPGFTDEDNIDTLAPDFVDSGEETQSAKTAKVSAAPPAKKKRGCARSFLTVVSIIVLAVVSVVIALIYFIYYKSADNGPF